MRGRAWPPPCPHLGVRKMAVQQRLTGNSSSRALALRSSGWLLFVALLLVLVVHEPRPAVPFPHPLHACAWPRPQGLLRATRVRAHAGLGIGGELGTLPGAQVRHVHYCTMRPH